MNFRILLSIILFMVMLVVWPGCVNAAPSSVQVHFFYSETCAHCQAARPVLEHLAANDSNVQLAEYSIEDTTNTNLFINISRLVGSQGAVPLIMVGANAKVGYSAEDSDDLFVKSLIESDKEAHTPDIVSRLINMGARDRLLDDSELSNFVDQLRIEMSLSDQQTQSSEDGAYTNGTISIPFFGKFDMGAFSLPVLTILLGLIDGFNPCAMWTLLFLISLLLGLNDRKKMWTLGIIFIATSASVYFALLATWLNLLLLVGFIATVRAVVGVFAIGAGGYNLYSGYKHRDGGCEVTGNEKRRRTFEKLKEIVQRKSILLSVVGIILLAIVVNMVDMLCSAGLPAIYAQILSMQSLSVWQYYAYISLYILAFMIDDMVVFIIATITLQAVGIQTKYGRITKVIGGIFMLIIGLLLLLRPEWLF